MSVVTTADEKIASAKEHIVQALSDILEILNPSTWGHDDISNDLINDLHEISGQLLKMKKKL